MPRKPPRSTEERLVRAQKSMMPGTLGGRVASAAPMALDVTRLDPRLRASPRVPPRIHPYKRFGAISAAADGVAPLYNDTNVALTVISVRAALAVAPTSTPVIVDVTVDGTSIFTGARPQVPVGATLGTPVPPDTALQWLPGQALYVNVVQGDVDATDLYVTIGVA